MSALPVRFYKGRIIPRFLYNNDENVIETVIQIYEDSLDHEFDEEVIREELEAIFGDFRMANAIRFVMRFFYTDVGKVEKVGNYDPFDLKRRFYSWVGRKYGFINSQRWENVVREFCKDIGIGYEEFKDFIKSELPQNRILTRKREKPTAKKVIGLYNFLIIEKLLSISEEVELKYYGGYAGRLVKELILRAKNHDVIAEFKKQGDDLVINVTGPYQIFKLPAVSEYGKHIAAVISPIIINYEEWTLYMKIIYRKRKAYFKMFGGKAPYLLPYWSIDKDARPREIYDSSIELRIYRLLEANMGEKGFTIKRESDVIILKSGKIMIPDFTVEYNGKKVFIEVIGYWREKYIEKKREKLAEMASEGYPIIGIADSRVGKKVSVKGVPIFLYDSNHIPFGRIYRAIVEVLK